MRKYNQNYIIFEAKSFKCYLNIFENKKFSKKINKIPKLTNQTVVQNSPVFTEDILKVTKELPPLPVLFI